jgi:Na+/melibiose symporter-like transporter
MMNVAKLRPWVTPLTIGTFTLMAVTGTLMFFHVQLGLVKPAHEWLSLGMVGAVGLHALVNWPALKRYFSQKVALSIIGVFALLTVVALAFPSQGGERGGADRQAVNLLLNLPLSTVASLSNKDVNSIQSTLTQQGFTVTDANATLRQIAETSKRNPMEALGKTLQQ